ncbi:hypothetical protein [Xanthomonas medicagonis]|uniref:hypothetical protein n=1 Tax=Xanthomonas medicagonis TaxID=3160841 RepID=UPI00351539C6
MAGLLLPLMALAEVGLLLSLYVNIASWFGLPIPGHELVWGLHLGIFVVWIPAVLVGNRATQGTPPEIFWKTVLSGCPAWMRYVNGVLFAYAALTFLWFMFTDEFPPHRSAGMPAGIATGFSGHWMAFYGAAFVIFYSAYRNPRLLIPPTCPEGHPVAAGDAFCSRCGKKIQVPVVNR